MVDQFLGPCLLLAYRDPWCCVEVSSHHQSSEDQVPLVPCLEGHSFSALAPSWGGLEVLSGPCLAAWDEDQVLHQVAG